MSQPTHINVKSMQVITMEVVKYMMTDFDGCIGMDDARQQGMGERMERAMITDI